MRAVVNPTGTHVQKGILKVRVDLYPDLHSKTYPIHNVDKHDRPLTPEEIDDPVLAALVPTHKEINPCLCHFIKVDEGITKAELTQIIIDTFDIKDTIDDLQSKGDFDGVKNLMLSRSGERKLVKDDRPASNNKLKADINTRIGVLEVEL